MIILSCPLIQERENGCPNSKTWWIFDSISITKLENAVITRFLTNNFVHVMKNMLLTKFKSMPIYIPYAVLFQTNIKKRKEIV